MVQECQTGFQVDVAGPLSQGLRPALMRLECSNQLRTQSFHQVETRTEIVSSEARRDRSALGDAGAGGSSKAAGPESFVPVLSPTGRGGRFCQDISLGQRWQS